MRKLKTTSTFRKDLKKLNANDTKETTAIIVKLQKDEPLEEKNRDHDLCLYKIDGCVTPHSLIDVFYMLSERTDATEDYCRETILKLRSVLTVIAEDSERVLLAAKNEEFSDFEDSMQNEAAQAQPVFIKIATDCVLIYNLCFFIVSLWLLFLVISPNSVENDFLVFFQCCQCRKTCCSI